MSSDDGKRIRLDNYQEFSDESLSPNEIKERNKILNQIRSKRYRDRKKRGIVIPQKQMIAVEVEQEQIRHTREYNKIRIQRYRKKKRVINLNLHTDRKTVVGHVSENQNHCYTQIPGSSKRNVAYVSTNTTADLMTHNNLNKTPAQLELSPQLPKPIPDEYSQLMNFMYGSVQTYSSFQLNSIAHREFYKDFYENDFGHTCDICDRMWFKKHITILDNLSEWYTHNIEFIRTLIGNVDVVEVKICSSCLTMINNDCVPPLSVYNGFKYPPIPENLKINPLCLVTERLVSPRIPFMQIRNLRHIHGEFGVYGTIINVPTDVNTNTRLLPRNIGHDHSVTVYIKKMKLHKSSHVYRIVDRTKIKAWLRYLKYTPLYIAYGIIVDENILNSQDDVHDEIYDEDSDSEISEQIAIENLEPQQHTLMWNDEMYSSNIPGEHEEELSFPQIYLGQLRNFRDGLNVTPSMIASSELRRSDRRGVTPQHLLYMAMKLMKIKIRDSLVIAFKDVGLGKAISGEQMKSENYLQGCIESNSAVLRTIPNSAYYWSEMKKDLFAMIRQYGRPTVSFTINANEVEWSKLLRLLYSLKYHSEISSKDVTALSSVEKSKLVNEDAVTCAVYFNKLINVLMKILQSKTFSPFNKYRISQYFKRIQFQHTGSPRAHILAWLDNAPGDTLNKDYKNAIDLIDFLVSVSAAEASGNFDLQTHNHNFTCYKETSSKTLYDCKFEAPFMPIKTTMILTPMTDTEKGFKKYNTKFRALRNKMGNYKYGNFQAIYADNNIISDQEYVNILRAGINRPTVFPKREPHEKWYHPFNPFILNIVKSPTDFHFIPDEVSCAAYVAEYIDKANRGVSYLRRNLIKIMSANQNVDRSFEITKNISSSLLNDTEITTQEAAWYLLKEPTWKSSAKIAYIPTVWPVERQKLKKIMNELNELVDSDIRKEMWFGKYEKRPKELENISLAQFVSKYKLIKGNYEVRDEPRVIRYHNYDMFVDRNEYKREMVTLHIPFRNEEAEILKDMKFIRLYDKNVDLIFLKRKEFESNIDIERALRIYRETCREDDTKEITEDRLAEEMNDDLNLARLNKLGSAPKKPNEELQDILFHKMHRSSTDNSMGEPCDVKQEVVQCPAEELSPSRNGDMLKTGHVSEFVDCTRIKQETSEDLMEVNEGVDSISYYVVEIRQDANEEEEFPHEDEYIEREVDQNKADEPPPSCNCNVLRAEHMDEFIDCTRIKQETPEDTMEVNDVPEDVSNVLHYEIEINQELNIKEEFLDEEGEGATVNNYN